MELTKTIIILFAFLVSFLQGYYLKQNEGVFTLTDDNFDYAIRDYDYVLVEFTEPNCRKCTEIDEEFRKAAKYLSKQSPPVYFAQIDTRINRQVAERFKVKGFPSFLYFHRGQQTQYHGGKDKFADFHNWVYKRVFSSVKTVFTEKQLQDEIELHDIVVTYFGPTDIKEFTWIYEMIARRYDNAFFLRAELNSDLEKSFNFTTYPQIVLFRHFEENQVVFGKNWTHRDMERWIVQRSAPLVFELSEKYRLHIFKHHHMTVILFRDDRLNHDKDLEDKFYQMARDLRNDSDQEEVLFATSDIRNSEQKKIADMIGISREHFPVLAVIHPHEKGVEKYLFTKQDLQEHMTYEKLSGFLHDQKTGKVKRHLKTQDNKEEIFLNGSVYQIKGNNKLKEFINQNDKDVVILFYQYFSLHSQRIISPFKEVAGIFRGQNVVFGMIDIALNDIDYVIGETPQIYLFKNGYKDRFIEYKGDRTRKSIADFIHRHSDQFQEYVDKNIIDLTKYEL